MVDFIQAFEEGKNAAKTVKDNNQEIESVFNALNEQIGKATNGKIEICPSISFSNFIKLADGMHEVQSPEIINGVIYAKNIFSQKALVKWDKSREGYPCKITIGNKQYYCENKAELENALALMLKDPIVADTLVELINPSEKQAA